MPKKGQVSLEATIVILFLISFIYVYNNLADQTVYSLQLSKIKEQEENVALSLSEFLQLQKNIYFDSNNITTYNSTYTIPSILLASQRVPCKITVSDQNIFVMVEGDWNVGYLHRVCSLSNIYSPLPSTLNCGQKISCSINLVTRKIECV